MRVLQVKTFFAQHFLYDFDKRSIGAFRHLFEIKLLVHIEEVLPQHGEGPIAFGKFDKLHVAPLVYTSCIDKGIRVAAVKRF